MQISGAQKVIVPNLGDGPFFAEPNCQGIPFGFYNFDHPTQIRRAPNNKLYLPIERSVQRRDFKSYFATSGICENAGGDLDAVLYREVILPFPEPVAHPLEIRSQ